MENPEKSTFISRKIIRLLLLFVAIAMLAPANVSGEGDAGALAATEQAQPTLAVELPSQNNDNDADGADAEEAEEHDPHSETLYKVLSGLETAVKAADFLLNPEDIISFLPATELAKMVGSGYLLFKYRLNAFDLKDAQLKKHFVGKFVKHLDNTKYPFATTLVGALIAAHFGNKSKAFLAYNILNQVIRIARPATAALKTYYYPDPNGYNLDRVAVIMGLIHAIVDFVVIKTGFVEKYSWKKDILFKPLGSAALAAGLTKVCDVPVDKAVPYVVEHSSNLLADGLGTGFCHFVDKRNKELVLDKRKKKSARKLDHDSTLNKAVTLMNPPDVMELAMQQVTGQLNLNAQQQPLTAEFIATTLARLVARPIAESVIKFGVTKIPMMLTDVIMKKLKVPKDEGAEQADEEQEEVAQPS